MSSLQDCQFDLPSKVDNLCLPANSLGLIFVTLGERNGLASPYNCLVEGALRRLRRLAIRGLSCHLSWVTSM